MPSAWVKEKMATIDEPRMGVGVSGVTDQDRFENLWAAGDLAAAHRFAALRVSGVSHESLCWLERAAFVRQLQALEGYDSNVISKRVAPPLQYLS